MEDGLSDLIMTLVVQQPLAKPVGSANRDVRRYGQSMYTWKLSNICIKTSSKHAISMVLLKSIICLLWYDVIFILFSILLIKIEGRIFVKSNNSKIFCSSVIHENMYINSDLIRSPWQFQKWASGQMSPSLNINENKSYMIYVI